MREREGGGGEREGVRESVCGGGGGGTWPFVHAFTLCMDVLLVGVNTCEMKVSVDFEVVVVHIMSAVTVRCPLDRL